MVRFKNRYVVSELTSVSTSKVSLEKGEIFHWMCKTVETIHGEFGVAAIRPGLSVKYYNPDTKICIVRVRHGPHTLLASALPFSTSFHNTKMQLRTLYVGASLACCYKFLQKHQRSQLDSVWSQLDSSEKQKLEESILDNDLLKFLEEVG